MTDPTPPTSDADDFELHLRYYEDQWTHIRHHECQMSNHTFQIIAFSGAMLLAMTHRDPRFVEQLGFAALTIALGVIGFLLTHKTHAAVLIHMARARHARVQIPKINQHAIDSDKFPNLYIYHKLFHASLVVLGIMLAISAVAAHAYGITKA